MKFGYLLLLSVATALKLNTKKPDSHLNLAQLKQGDRLFGMADANYDHKLSWDEFKAKTMKENPMYEMLPES